MDCPFCAIEKYGRSRRFDEVIGSERAEVIFQDDEYAVVPDIAPIRRGHLLLVSKTHCYNALSFWKSSSSELRQFLENANKKLRHSTGCEFGAFEHGSSKYENGPCISHAHVHLVPVCADDSISALIQETAGDEGDVIGEDAFHQSFEHEYLAARAPGETAQFVVGTRIESQSMRKRFSDVEDFWHWEDWLLFPEKTCTVQRIEFALDLFG